MFNFREALTYIFKEKDWGYKFLIPFIFQLLMLLPSAVLSASQSRLDYSGYLVKSSSALGRSGIPFQYYNTASLNSGPNGLALLMLCLILVSFVPYIVVSIWYMYENTQAGIENRKTKGIWKNDLSDTLRKIGKYLLNSIIYGLIIGFVALIGLAIVGIIGIALYILAAAVFQNIDLTGFGNSRIFVASGLWLFGICLVSIIGTIAYFFAYAWSTFGGLRLIATNTFSEGLKFKENWQIAMKYKWRFLELMLIIFLASFIFGLFIGIISIPITIITMLPNIPVFFGVIANVVLQAVIAIPAIYGSYFVYPRLLGQLFRGISSKERLKI